MKVKKNIGFALVITLLCLTVGGFLYRQIYKNNQSRVTRKTMAANIPTPTKAKATAEIANNAKIANGLQQYISPTYKYSFVYPVDWQLLDEPNVSGLEIQKIDKLGEGFSISIRTIDNPQKLSVADFAKSQTLNPKDTTQKIEVGNQAGYKLNYLPEGLLVNLYLPYDEKSVLNIFAGGGFTKDKQTVNYYNNIVKTFLDSFKY